MIPHGKNMSKTLIPQLAHEPLQLAFMQAEQINSFSHGLTHWKTTPYTIVAQACEGTYEVWCDGRHEIISAGEVFVVPVHTPVKITHWAGKRRVMSARWLHLRYSIWGMIDFFSMYDIPLKLPGPTGRRLGKIIGNVLALQSEAGSGFTTALSRFEQALSALKLICEASSEKKQTLTARSLRLHPVLRYIQENLSREIDVDKLAKAANLSSAQFHALFREEFKVTPMKYVRSMRLDEAARLLITKNLTLSQVAESTGFKDPFHFSHAFKAQFRVSPRQYREQASIQLF